MPDKLGMILIGLGVACLVIGRFAERVFRWFFDREAAQKEEQLNEASKNSALNLSEYRTLKRQYDAEKAKNKK